MLRPLKNLLCALFTLCSLAVIHPADGQEPEPIRLNVVEWGPDGVLIAVAGGNTNGCNLTPDPTAMILLLDAITSEVQQTLVGSLCDVRSLSWNTDGSRLVSSETGEIFRIWDPGTGEQVAASEPLFKRGDVYWSPDNTKIANLWASHFIIELFDASTLTSLILLGEDTRFVFYKVIAVDWNVDSTQLVSVGRKSAQSPDGFLHVWDVETGELLIEKDLQTIPFDVDWKSDGSQLVVGARDGTISIFDAETFEEVNRFAATEDLNYVKWHPFLDVLAIGTDNEASPLSFWEIEDGSQHQLQTDEAPMGVGDWSPFGGRFAYVPSPLDTTEAAESVSMLTPVASFELLDEITQRCVPDADLVAPSIAAQLADFVETVSATDDLAPACAADLIVVAEALQQ